VTTNDEQIIDEIIDSYIQLPACGGAKQYLVEEVNQTNNIEIFT
jgi:hypothetical protein